ncbi:hypothetical protein [Gordonia terrae]
MPDPFHALVLMNLLFVVGAWCLARPSYPAAAILFCTAAAWLFWNVPIEGRVLLVVRPGNGLTESDLLSAVAFGIVAITAWRERERRRYESD